MVLICVLGMLLSGVGLSVGKGLAEPAADGAEPFLYRMMAYSDKVDSIQDELRMDLVLRVRHGAFDPTCGGKVGVGAVDGGTCSLLFVYQLQGNWLPNKYRMVRYLNTIAGGKVDGSAGAATWAANKDEYYTVHSITNSGEYDYLTVSIEGDLDYWNTRADINKNYKLSDVFGPGGFKQPLNVYAVTGNARSDKKKPVISCSGSPWNVGTSECASFDPTKLDSKNSADLSVQLATEDRPGKIYDTRVYMGDGCYAPDPGVANRPANRWLCNGPRAFVGWDGNPAQLWSKGQSNWGLVTDYGFKQKSSANGLKEDYGPGVAPPNSFFVFWYNNRQYTGSGMSVIDPGYYYCSQNTSFYYQWVALKKGSWVPVTSLTPQAVLVRGQMPYNSSSSVEASASWAGSVPGSALNVAPDATKAPNTLYAVDANGNPMPAQEKSGAINFAKAKNDQDLDGYFRLVTWPVTDSVRNPNDKNSIIQCPASASENPLMDQAPSKGITEDMSQDQIENLLSQSWSVGTAYYRYDVTRPDAPVITRIGGEEAVNSPGYAYINSQSPMIEGTCVPSVDDSKPSMVTLYGEDPANPISDVDPNRYDTRGYTVGSTACVPDSSLGPGKGAWQIQDKNTYPGGAVNRPGSSRRYHAWVTEKTAGFDMTSYFSNLPKVIFAYGQEPSPTMGPVSVPHTRRDESTGQTDLPQGSVVRLTGKAMPAYVVGQQPSGGPDTFSRDSRLTVTAVPHGGLHKGEHMVLGSTDPGSFIGAPAARTASARADPPGKVTVARSKEANVWSWSIRVDPQQFLLNMDGSTESQVYTFGAYLTNPAGVASDVAQLDWTVDMTPSDPGVEQVDWHQVSGKAIVAGHLERPDPGAQVTVAWPGGRTDTVTADASTGLWRVPMPKGVPSGEVNVTMVDDQGNQSKRFSYNLTVGPPLTALPLTGGSSRLDPLILWLVALGLVAALMSLRRQHRFDPPTV